MEIFKTIFLLIGDIGGFLIDIFIMPLWFLFTGYLFVKLFLYDFIKDTKYNFINEYGLFAWEENQKNAKNRIKKWQVLFWWLIKYSILIFLFIGLYVFIISIPDYPQTFIEAWNSLIYKLTIRFNS